MNAHLTFATTFAYMLDNLFGFGKFKFGLSTVFGLIPWLGDVIDALLSMYIVWIAVEMKAPKTIIARMIGNIAVNFVVGLVPVVGDSVYFLRKVNTKNVNLLKQYASSHHVIQGELVATQ
ncbi:MAG TPA: DUF4112 domain-containing protein [Candidatus Saccharimonadales bacterium]|nr:DUF4112 domain-containing protein [Candidatus Saccharimonadales bacterium]